MAAFTTEKKLRGTKQSPQIYNIWREEVDGYIEWREAIGGPVSDEQLYTWLIGTEGRTPLFVGNESVAHNHLRRHRAQIDRDYPAPDWSGRVRAVFKCLKEQYGQVPAHVMAAELEAREMRPGQTCLVFAHEWFHDVESLEQQGALFKTREQWRAVLFHKLGEVGSALCDHFYIQGSGWTWADVLQ
jgi:hypothetical protein